MRRILVAGAAVALATAAIAPRYISAQSAPPWTTFHGDSMRDGISPATGPKGSAGVGQVLNAFHLTSTLQTSPAVGPDGTAYIGDDGGHFYALGAGTSPTPKWIFPATGKVGPIHSSPTLSSDGSRVFFATETGIVYALKTSDGSQVWTRDLQSPINSSALMSKDGSQIFVNTEAGSVYSLKTTDGSTVWGPYTPGYPIPVSMALSPDGGTIFIPFANQQLYGIPSSGPQQGAGTSVYYLAQDASGTPAIDPNGNIYVPTRNGYMDQFAPGTASPTAFSRSINGSGKAAVSTPTFANGLVIFGAGGDTYLHAWNAGTGTQTWQFTTGAAVGSSPVYASGGGGEIIFGSDDGYVYAVNTNGTLLWKTNVGTGVESSPAIAPDGSVWVSNGIGSSVYHIADLAPPPTQPTSFPTGTATATSAVTSTPTATATATATATSAQLPLTASVTLPQVAPGQKETVNVTSAANTNVFLLITYPNGDQQHHKVTTDASGTAVQEAHKVTTDASGKGSWTFTQGSNKNTHKNQTASIAATVGTGATQNSKTVTYTIKWGTLDVSVEPNKIAPGGKIEVFAHAKKGSKLEAFLILPGGRLINVDKGTAGKKGFVSKYYTVPKNLVKGHNVKVTVLAKFTNGKPSITEKTTLTIT